jgi:hypothetical protein
MSSVDAGTIYREYTQHIQARPEQVFPLLCPVREGEWLEGWAQQCEIIHSLSGRAEEGCVFRTRAADGPETIWQITRHDQAEKVVEFARVTAGVAATRLTIRVEPAPAGASFVHVRYLHTPLSRAGAELLEAANSEAAFRRNMTWWEDSMNHWLRTGEQLRAAG